MPKLSSAMIAEKVTGIMAHRAAMRIEHGAEHLAARRPISSAGINPSRSGQIAARRHAQKDADQSDAAAHRADHVLGQAEIDIHADWTSAR